MPLRDAYFWLQENVPELDSGEVIGLLKGLERVGFNKANEVLSYVVSLFTYLFIDLAIWEVITRRKVENRIAILKEWSYTRRTSSWNLQIYFIPSHPHPHCIIPYVISTE